MLYKKIIADYFDNFKTAINIVCGQNYKLLNVEGGSAYSTDTTQTDLRILAVTKIEHCNSIQFISIQCCFVDKIFSVVNLQCILVICCSTMKGS